MATVGKVPGKLIQFMIDEEVMGCSDKASLNIDFGSTDAKCKGDGDWTDSVDGTRSWSMDVSGFVHYDATKPITEVVTAALNQAGTAGVPVVFGTTAPGDPIYSGNAQISNIKIEAGTDGAATYSFSLKGKGPLVASLNPVTP